MEPKRVLKTQGRPQVRWVDKVRKIFGFKEIRRMEAR